jgi:hypothetical protein
MAKKTSKKKLTYPKIVCPKEIVMEPSTVKVEEVSEDKKTMMGVAIQLKNLLDRRQIDDILIQQILDKLGYKVVAEPTIKDIK